MASPEQRPMAVSMPAASKTRDLRARKDSARQRSQSHHPSQVRAQIAPVAVIKPHGERIQILQSFGRGWRLHTQPMRPKPAVRARAMAAPDHIEGPFSCLRTDRQRHAKETHARNQIPHCHSSRRSVKNHGGRSNGIPINPPPTASAFNADTARSRISSENSAWSTPLLQPRR